MGAGKESAERARNQRHVERLRRGVRHAARATPRVLSTSWRPRRREGRKTHRTGRRGRAPVHVVVMRCVFCDAKRVARDGARVRDDVRFTKFVVYVRYTVRARAARVLGTRASRRALRARASARRELRLRSLYAARVTSREQARAGLKSTRRVFYVGLAPRRLARETRIRRRRRARGATRPAPSRKCPRTRARPR